MVARSLSERVHGSVPIKWRGGRVVEGACLESKCTFTRTVGSNPTLSAIIVSSRGLKEGNLLGSPCHATGRHIG